MPDLHFATYKEGTEGKMATMLTTSMMIPVNIHLEPGSDLDLTKDTVCSVEIFADEDELYIYKNEEEYLDAGQGMDSHSLIPVGTFDTNPDGDPVKESPFIIFTGEVTNVVENPTPNSDDPPDYLATINSLDLTFNLYLYSDEPVEKGCFIHGMAWLFGVVKKKRSD